MILPSLFITSSEGRGRGVFTQELIPEATYIEMAPVIVMPPKDRPILDQSLLHDYIFEWGDDLSHCAMALGYVSVYNHSYQANCEYEMDYDNEIIKIKTVRTVQAGEELFINYNGTWNDEKPVWFDVIQ